MTTSATSASSATAARTVSRLRHAAMAVSAAAIPIALLLPAAAAAASPVDGGFDGVPEFTPVGTIPFLEPPEPAPTPTLPTFVLPELSPDLIDDLTIPTLPPDDACNEYDADFFSVAVGRYDDERIEVQLAYSDIDVCDYTVWTSYWNTADLGAGAASSSMLGMASVAFATDSAGYYQLTIDDHDFCDWEVRVAVEEGLAAHYPGTEECDPPVVPGDDPEEVPGDTPDDGPEDVPGDTPDDGPEDVPGDTPDDGPEDVPGDTPDDGPGDTPDDGPEDVPGDTPGDEPDPEIEERPIGGDDSSSPGPGLPATGVDGTRLMLGLGLLILGFGSIVALLTRRRDEVPAL